MIHPRATAILAVAGLSLLATGPASASCAGAFCSINTDYSLPAGQSGSGLRLNLRYEYIDQDQPRHGSDEIAVGEISSHDDEVRTINRNWIASLDYAFNQDWGVAVTAPFARRYHFHIHNHHGEQLPETWRFTELGDVQVLGRRQWHGWRAAPADQGAARYDSYGLNFGLKLPTGQTGVQNADGDPGERSLQPGSGTTDVLLGAYYQSTPVADGWSWFTQGLYQAATGSHHGYRPGARLSLNVGGARKLSGQVSAMLQLNTLFRARDRGVEAEPQDSGGKFVFLSPGVSWAVTHSTAVYGFLQKPIYQYVNGVQLTADWSATVGVGMTF